MRVACRTRAVMVCLALVAAVGFGACSKGQSSPPNGATKTTIAGHAAVQMGKGTTAIVMIHGASTHKDSFNSLLPKIAAAGDWAIAYDYNSSGSAEVDKIVAFARTHGAEHVVLIGSSLGAEHALESAGALHVDAVVTFSSEVERTVHEPLLAIASEHDGSTATYAANNVTAAGPRSRLDVVSGSTHGIDLVHPHPEVMTRLIAWLSQVVPK